MHGVLDDLGVHVERRDAGVLAHGLEDGVGGVADAGLHGEEILGDETAAKFGGQELGDVPADARGDRGALGERADLVREVGFDDAGDLPGVHLDDGRSDTIRGAEKEQGVAARRIIRLEDVVEPVQGLGMKAIELDQNPVGDPAEGGRGADGGREGDFACVIHGAGLDDRPLDGAQKSVAEPPGAAWTGACRRISCGPG